jgi:uncharacterized tellurite resistance protein B-like protein
MDASERVTVAQVIGQMLISDGALSDAERDHFERLMDRLGMDAAEKKQAIAGIDVDSPVEERVERLGGEVRDKLLVELESAMNAGGEVAPGERILLDRVKALLGA